MRLPRTREHGNSHDESFMTPMIDVVFQLLIFFICASAAYVIESHLPTPLSSGAIDAAIAQQQAQPLGEVWLKLMRVTNPDGAIVTQAELNDRLYENWDKLRQTLRELAEVAPEIPVILDIEQNVPVGDVVDIYDTCRAARFQQVRFATSLNSTKTL